MGISALQQNSPTAYPPFSELALMSRIRIVVITFLVSLLTFGLGGKSTYNSLRGRVSPPLLMPIDALAKTILDRNKRIEELEREFEPDDPPLKNEKRIRERNIESFKRLFRQGNKPKIPEAIEVVSQLKLQPLPGQTLAHGAARIGDLDLIKTLIERHPDWLNAKDNFGHTPLHVALFEKQEKMALALIEEMGADTEVNEGQPFTLLELSERGGLTSVKHLLESYGNK